MGLPSSVGILVLPSTGEQPQLALCHSVVFQLNYTRLTPRSTLDD